MVNSLSYLTGKWWDKLTISRRKEIIGKNDFLKRNLSPDLSWVQLSSTEKSILVSFYAEVEERRKHTQKYVKFNNSEKF